MSASGHHASMKMQNPFCSGRCPTVPVFVLSVSQRGSAGHRPQRIVDYSRSRLHVLAHTTQARKYSEQKAPKPRPEQTRVEIRWKALGPQSASQRAIFEVAIMFAGSRHASMKMLSRRAERARCPRSAERIGGGRFPSSTSGSLSHLRLRRRRPRSMGDEVPVSGEGDALPSARGEGSAGLFSK